MDMVRIIALFEKDMKDFFRNMMLLFLPVSPILIAFLYKQTSDGQEIPLLMIYMVIGIAFSGVTASSIMFMMAEEKEKNTLRGLIMSPMSFLDIIIGKSLVTSVITIVTLIVTFAILGFNPFLGFQIMLGHLFLLLFFLFLGIFIGLITSSTATTIAYNMPVIFIFGFTPMYDMLAAENEVLQKILGILPLTLQFEVHENESWLSLGYLFIWVIAALLICYLAYKRILGSKQ